MILDGWGITQDPKVSAVYNAKTPYINSLYNKYPNAELRTDGEHVGLPKGQMGNSEVGHMNLGAGRIVYQNLARINKAVKEKTLGKEKVLLDTFEYAKKNNKNVHLLGLVSNGGIHAHINHLKGLLDVAKENKIENIYLHAFSDGRDCDPKSGTFFIKDIQEYMKKTTGQLASVTGRYYAMDRDNRWERVQKAYHGIVNGVGTKTTNIVDVMTKNYDNGITDEFHTPIIATNKEGSLITKIEEGDAVIFFNYRTDRGRELTNALSQNDFPEFGMKKLDLYYTTITMYDESFKGINVIYNTDNIKNTLGASRDIAQAGDQFFNLFELGADLKLSFPRLVFPFFENTWASVDMNPVTQMILGSSIQQNIGLDKQFFKATYQFDWQPKKNKKVQIKWIELEFVNNRNLSNYFNVYKNSYDRLNTIADTFNIQPKFVDVQGNLSIPDGTEGFINAVLNNETILDQDDDDYKIVNTVKERQDRLTANNLILGSSLSMNFNSQESIFDENFYQLRWKIDWVGNLLNGFLRAINASENEQGQTLLGGVSPSQYVKTEVDYIKHWPLGKERVIAFHAFGGIAIPYGNATNMPFSRSYFSGGSNDNRAWKAYKLGPGSSNNINEFNEANFKLAFNIEYRFPLSGPLKGGFFIDAGNVWNIFDDIEDSEFRFDGVQDLSEIAIGSGIGLRYDFDFFVFRFDTGFKTYNPALPQGERWWKEYNLKSAVFNIGINYPF